MIINILDNNENVFGFFLIQNWKIHSKTNNNVIDLKANQKPLENNLKERYHCISVCFYH